MRKYVDDKFVHLESDIEKIRKRHRQYISYSGPDAAMQVAIEILANALDETKNPRSPGNKIDVYFDERTGFLTIEDNGRGIPTAILEEVFTSLNMGSNIDTTDKAAMKLDVLGSNGVGTIATTALAERVEITSYRGGTENVSKTLIFEEGIKVHEEDAKCPPSMHGMKITYKPSKVLGKTTRLIWENFHKELVNLQYLGNKNKVKITSVYVDKDGVSHEEKYKNAPFEEILKRNDGDKIISGFYNIVIDTDDVIEEVDGMNVKRYISMDTAFVYTSSLNPYIDSFSNSNNTVDNGDHLDGAIEALCRFFQAATKNSMSEKEREKLDIKWDDVRTGLSIAVSLRTNFERLYTGQTKHKVVSPDIKKIIISLSMDSLSVYFEKNPSQLKEITNIIKMNARVRREGDKLKSAVVKTSLTNWSSYKMKNFDPCTNKGLKEYKELFIIEGDSAKGSLITSRDPHYQALFAIRGVSANVFKLSLDQIIGPKGNKEFTDLVTIMGCNAGLKFDMNKLQYNKIIIASDADVDGLFIRSLLLAFFFKLFPDIIRDGRVFIAEPPLYRVDDKKNPFVINKKDYIDRYVNEASKHYKLGYQIEDDKGIDIKYLRKSEWAEFLDETSSYVDEILGLVNHYKVNDRLIEMILEEFAMNFDMNDKDIAKMIESINIQNLIDRINIEFPELYYDDKDQVIKGAIDGKWQMIEISSQLIRKAKDLIIIMQHWLPSDGSEMVLKDVKTASEHKLSLLGILKILKKYQPTILHRFKGLGENDTDDIRTTIMDPNTRTLIRVNIEDIENDMAIFQMLRGGSPSDAAARKQMMKDFHISKEFIDT